MHGSRMHAVVPSTAPTTPVPAEPTHPLCHSLLVLETGRSTSEALEPAELLPAASLGVYVTCARLHVAIAIQHRYKCIHAAEAPRLNERAQMSLRQIQRMEDQPTVYSYLVPSSLGPPIGWDIWRSPLMLVAEETCSKHPSHE